MSSQLDQRLLKRTASGNIRSLRVIPDLIDFASNDYLGLARSPDFAAAVMQECRTHENPLNGLGSTGSRLLTGNSLYAQDLENKIAAFHGFEAGLLFSCGYMANVGLLSALPGSDDRIFFDEQVHASTHDGIRLSRAKAFPFRHNDLKHLEARLKNCSIKGDRFICVESIYSTDGSKAPLVEICRLAKEYEALLIVDEAHATGVSGPRGHGLVEEYNLTDHIFAKMITFGKALGAYGAIVLGSDRVKQGLINFATSLIYTTALPFHSLAAIKCSYDLFPMLERERRHLHKLIQMFRVMHPKTSETHIQSIAIQGNEQVSYISKKLAEEGFNVRPLMSPTVKKGKEVLRICLHAFNTENDLVTLIERIKSEHSPAI